MKAAANQFNSFENIIIKEICNQRIEFKNKTFKFTLLCNDYSVTSY